MFGLEPANKGERRFQTEYGQAIQAQRLDELDTFIYGGEAMNRTQRDIIDSIAAGDAATGALDAEIGLYERGMTRANGSAVGEELVIRHVNALSWRNIRRIDRVFGA